MCKTAPRHDKIVVHFNMLRVQLGTRGVEATLVPIFSTVRDTLNLSSFDIGSERAHPLRIREGN
jgi:hypothetical protein